PLTYSPTLSLPDALPSFAGRIGNTPTYSRNDNPLAEFINDMNSDSTAEPKMANPPAQPKPSEAEDKKSEKAAKPKADKKPADASDRKRTRLNSSHVSTSY